MNIHPNPMGREYTKAEIAAGVRVGVARREKKYNPWPQVEIVTTGQLIYATGTYWPDHARKMADDWKLVADAMDREWKKES